MIYKRYYIIFALTLIKEKTDKAHILMGVIKTILVLSSVAMFCMCTPEGEQHSEWPSALARYDSVWENDVNRVDSLISDIQKVKQTKPEFAAEVDTRMAWFYSSKGNADSVLHYSNLAIAGFEAQKDKGRDKEIRFAELKLLKAYWLRLSEPKSSLALLDECVKEFTRLGKTRRIIEAWLYKSDIMRCQNDYKECLKIIKHIESVCDTAIFSTGEHSWALMVLSEVAEMATDLMDYYTSDDNIHLAANYYDNADTADKAAYITARARMHLYRGEYEMAIYYCERLEELATELNDYNVLHFAYAMKGIAYCRLRNYQKATEVYNQNKNLIAAHRQNIYISNEGIALDGEIAAVQNRFDESHTLLFDSLEHRRFRFDYVNMLESQKTYYRLKNDYKKVNDLHDRQKQYSDSLYYIVILPQQQERIKNDKRRYYEVSTSLYSLRSEYEELNIKVLVERVIFVLILIVCMVIYLRNLRVDKRHHEEMVKNELDKLRNENKTNTEEIERQRGLQEITNERITESIMYAERIQHAILPPVDKLNNYDIAGSFIFYNPLDVVSGDFYWFTQKGDWLYVACADCTGHGVPGAFMSMIAAITLDNIVSNSKKFIDPGDVLEQLDAKIKDHLGRNTTDQNAMREGLDIALVAINVKTKRVRVSAARRPVIIIRDQSILTFSGARRSIGDKDELICSRNFVTEEFKMHADDCIYMYSDGYNDQIGGSDGVKLNHAKIKHFIRAIHNDDMDEQGLTIQELFMQWKADFPQVDDVLFIGIKL